TGPNAIAHFLDPHTFRLLRLMEAPDVVCGEFEISDELSRDQPPCVRELCLARTDCLVTRRNAVEALTEASECGIAVRTHRSEDRPYSIQKCRNVHAVTGEQLLWQIFRLGEIVKRN